MDSPNRTPAMADPITAIAIGKFSGRHNKIHINNPHSKPKKMPENKNIDIKEEKRGGGISIPIFHNNLYMGGAKIFLFIPFFESSSNILFNFSLWVIFSPMLLFPITLELSGSPKPRRGEGESAEANCCTFLLFRWINNSTNK